MTTTKQVDRMLGKKDVKGLCRAVTDRNIQVRRRAVRALGKLADPYAIPHLESLLPGSQDRYLIQYTLSALGAIGNEEAVNALVRAMFSTRRDIAFQAEQELTRIGTPPAQAAVRIHEAVTHGNLQSIREIGGEAKHTLELLMATDEYRSWPAGKRKEIATLAVELGARPPSQASDDLADMGVFVSGVHTLGDVMRGLRDQNPRVRASAAERLGTSGLRIAVPALWRRFKKEVREGGSLEVAAAIGRALEQFDDKRALEHYIDQLYEGGAAAPQAAHGLATIGTPGAVDALFWFAADPPPPPAYRNVESVMTALESLGPRVVDTLHRMVEHPSSAARRTIAKLIASSNHRDATLWLGELGRDPEASVQIAAINGLAKLNTAHAAQTLRELAGDVPRDEIVKALARITDPAGLSYIRALDPTVTTISGVLLSDRNEPLARAGIELQGEHDYGGTTGWQWKPISPRVITGPDGRFAFSVLELGTRGTVRMKVLPPGGRRGASNQRYVSDLRLTAHAAHSVEARLDAFLDRLLVTVDVIS